MRPKTKFTQASRSTIRRLLHRADEISLSEINEFIDAIRKRQPIPTKVQLTTKNEHVGNDDNIGNGNILTYPMSCKGAITLSLTDYECLERDVYLNDVIIDFFLKYIQLEEMSAEQREKTHIFSTFFFKALTSRGRSIDEMSTRRLNAAQKRHDGVKKWTKDVNIFEKDFIVIPINESEHWYLAIICFPALATTRNANSKNEMPSDANRSSRGSLLAKKRRTSQLIDDEIDSTSDNANNSRMLRSQVSEQSCKR